MDFAHRGPLSTDEWRRRGREQIERALSYSPRQVPLDLHYLSTVQKRGYKRHLISFAGTDERSASRMVMLPRRVGVIAPQ